MRNVLLALAVFSLCSCVVYKSSDRDDFNVNGKARAPASKPTDSCVEPTSLTPADTVLKTDAGQLVKLADGSLHPLCE